MWNKYFMDKRFSGLTDDSLRPDYDKRLGLKRDSLKVPKQEAGVHVWVFRISIVVAILLLISFYFIPFPINLILFIISLIIFLIISFWVHIRVKRQSNKDLNSYASNRLSGDQSFVDVPLELISDNGFKIQTNLA